MHYGQLREPLLFTILPALRMHVCLHSLRTCCVSQFAARVLLMVSLRVFPLQVEQGWPLIIWREGPHLLQCVGISSSGICRKFW